MTDSFWAMIGVVLPVLIVQIFQYLAIQRNAKKSEASRVDIKAQVCEVAAHINTILDLSYDPLAHQRPSAVSMASILPCSVATSAPSFCVTSPCIVAVMAPAAMLSFLPAGLS